jgi:hypothetical protein
MGAESFKVGDRVSYCVGSDRYAGAVIKVSPARVVVQGDGPGGYEVTFTRREDGRFLRKGWYGHGVLSLGGEAYRDPSF